MVPAFFVPEPDGTARDKDDAKRVYELCRKEAEREAGREAVPQPVFRLRFVHDGRDMTAEVGQLDPYGYQRLVIAIVPFPDHYWICSSAPNHIVGTSAARHVEHFAQPAPK
jgi:hypothetical protein